MFFKKEACQIVATIITVVGGDTRARRVTRPAVLSGQPPLESTLKKRDCSFGLINDATLL